MGWYEAFKDAAAVVEKLKDAEAMRAMATVQMEGAKLAQENAQLRDENHGLRQTLRNREAMAFHENAYWIERDGRREGPFCPRCQDADGKAVRMLNLQPDYHAWKCPNCPTVVHRQGRSHEQPEDFQPPREPIR